MNRPSPSPKRRDAASSAVAFWVQLDPGQQMRGEGIGEHMMRLLGGMAELGEVRPIVFAPRWAEGVMQDMLDSHGLAERVELRVFGPWFVTLLSMLRRRRAPRRRDPLVWRVARRIVDLPAWTLLAALALLAAPFALLGWALVRVAGRYVRPRLIAIALRVRRLAHALTYAQMARAIDRDRAIAGCIVPIGSWDFCRYIERKPVIVQIPDMVFLEFPDHFRDQEYTDVIIERARFVAEHAGAVICPSQHVKTLHLVQGMGIEAHKVFVIDHAPMRVDREFAAQCGARGLRPTRQSAIAICKDYQRDALVGPAYLRRIGGSGHWAARVRDPAIWARPKLYFPSQYRPYKNIERLISAVGKLRDAGFDVTLLLTADLESAPQVRQLAEARGLQDRVIPLPRVTPEMHAVLYAAADLAITPSSFEGGFPFMFSEALSVKTPVLMARIPVTLAKIQGPMLERMTFDPENVEQIAARVRAALADAALLADQQQLYERVFATRGWRDVARDYLEAMQFAGAVLRIPA
jgi:hypothetical protein